MTLISRLTSNGDLISNVPLDEVTKSINSQTPTTVFSAEFDEVTGIDGVKKETSDGKLIISGSFDETGVI